MGTPSFLAAADVGEGRDELAFDPSQVEAGAAATDTKASRRQRSIAWWPPKFPG